MFPNNNKIGVKGTQNTVNSHLVTQNLHKVHLGEKLPMSPKLARKRCINPLVLDTRFALPLPHALPTGLPARHEATHSLPPSPPPSPSPTLRRSGLDSSRLSSPSSPPLKGLLSSWRPGVSWAYACHCCEAKKDKDLFAIWRGDMVCKRYCKKYSHSICRHRPMNVKQVVAARTKWLYSVIIDDGKRRNGKRRESHTIDAGSASSRAVLVIGQPLGQACKAHPV